MNRLKYRSLVRTSLGFTLIELLLYIAIVGTLLVAIMGFFALSVDSRVKNQTISEVDQQGAAVMDAITQSVRNASAITAPNTGASAASLNLAMPIAGVNPTVFDLSGGGSTTMGYDVDGDSTDTSDSNFMNATRFTASASGTVSILYTRVGSTIGASPNNKAQMAIFSGTAAAPTTLLANSSDQTLTANAWNAFSIAPTAVTSGQIYWLAYNTNGTASTQNNIRYHAVGSAQSQYVGRTYGTWPASWPGGTNSSTESALYATIATGGGTTGTMQVKKGVSAIVGLNSSDTEISGLTFKNLSRAGTPGLIQVSFTISYVSTSTKNEYDYQKTFTSTAAIR
jgi:type II secretory pathway pseudopilin PulG